jgi:putative SOS response-associated peptidase YedK
LIGQEAERAPLRKNFRDWILRYVCNAAADSAKHHKLSHCIFAAVDGEHQLFGFLTTNANPVVAPIHPKAMLAILTMSEEVDQWLEADTVDALTLQRPLPDDVLRIVAKGEKEDGVAD